VAKANRDAIDTVASRRNARKAGSDNLDNDSDVRGAADLVVNSTLARTVCKAVWTGAEVSGHWPTIEMDLGGPKQT